VTASPHHHCSLWCHLPSPFKPHLYLHVQAHMDTASMVSGVAFWFHCTWVLPYCLACSFPRTWTHAKTSGGLRQDWDSALLLPQTSVSSDVCLAVNHYLDALRERRRDATGERIAAHALRATGFPDRHSSVALR